MMLLEKPRFDLTSKAQGGEPSGLSEIVDSSFDEFLSGHSSIGRAVEVDQAYDRRIETIKRETGEQLSHPLDDVADPRDLYYPPVANMEPVDDGGVQQIKPRYDPQAAFKKQLDDVAEKHPDKRDIIGPDRPILEDTKAMTRAKEKRAAEVWERSDKGALAWAARLGGGFYAAMHDPINIGTLAVGGGPAGVGVRGLAWMALKQGAANAGAEAAIQPFVQSWRKEAGMDYGVSMAALDIGMAGVFGAGLDAGVRSAVRGVRNVAGRPYRGPDPLPPVEALERAARAAPEGSILRKAGEGDPDALREVAKQAGLENDPTVKYMLDEVEAQKLFPAPEGVDDGQHLADLARAIREESGARELPAGDAVIPAMTRPVADLADEVPGRAVTIEDKPVSFRSVNPSEVVTDATQFQFKSGGDLAGVTDRLRGVERWDPVSAGKTIVFERESGELVIADGHQRLGLAQRLSNSGQEAKLDAFIFREKDGWTPEDVRAYAALKNMRESSGNSLDMAKVMRERPDLIDGSLPLSDAKLREATMLSRLSPVAFDAVVAGRLPPPFAALIGESVMDTSRHAGLLDELAAANLQTIQQTRLYLKQLLELPTTTETQMTLFGEESFTRTVLLERTKVLDSALKSLRTDKRIFNLLQKEAGTIEGAGNVLARDVNAAKAEGAAQLADLIERLATSRGTVATILNDAAASVSRGYSPTLASRAFVARIGDIMEREGIPGLLKDAEAIEPELSPRPMDEPNGAEAKAQTEELEALIDADQQSLFALKAHHSSPFDFDRFDSSRINTGEGAQAFGHGLYFADSERVAESYAKSVPDQQLLREAKEAYSEFDDPDSALEMLLESATLSDRQKRFLSALAKDDWFGFDYPHQAIRAALRDDPKNWDASQETLAAIKGLSTRYEVNIKAEPEDFIDWDAPLTDQPVFKKLSEMHFSNDGFTDVQRADYMRKAFPDKGMTGGDYYRKMIRQFGSDKAASEFMAKSGIAGIRYLDRASRKSGEGTRNTVVFDDRLVEITGKDGKPTKGAARKEAIDEQSLFALKAYHGTPHDFDRFSMDKIGTGEGAQVFGHGLYFAENEDVGLRYKSDIGGFDTYVDGKPFIVGGKLVGTTGNKVLDDALTMADGNIGAAIHGASQMAHVLESVNPAAAKAQREIADALSGFTGEIETREAGLLYEVDIDVEPHQLLDHDAKLADQPEMLAKVAQILKQAGSDVLPDILRAQPGSWVYSELEAFLGSAGAASNALKDAGIPGLRYLDQGSRGAGEGSRNIVIFDDSLIKITKKNGEPITAKERQDAVEQMFALPGFYSPAIRAAESISMKKGTGEQFWKQITKTPNVRKDELEWMGLEEFLSGKKSVTKDEVLEFMQAHQVEMDEVELGGKAATKFVSDEEFKSDTRNGRIVTYDADGEQLRYFIAETERNGNVLYQPYRWDHNGVLNGPFASYDQALHVAQGDAATFAKRTAAPKFEDYKVPGGENYRELLIRLPELGEQKLTREQQSRLEQIPAELEQIRSRMGEGDAPQREALRREFQKLEAEKRAIEATPEQYTSKHFNDQEIVHLRVDDRTGPNGEKVLFINEVQSDLHQAGRQQGYAKKSSGDIVSEIMKLDEEISPLRDKVSDDSASPEEMARYEEIRERLFALEDEERRLTKMPPNAPFKGDLWLELALKRALRYASENGYDAISWARSDQIAKAVGAEPEKLALQYDSKIGKFLDKYTKKWGAKVEEAAVVETRSNDGTRGNQRDLRNLDGQIAANERALGGELTDTARAQVETQLGLLREQRAALSGKDGEGMNPILRVTPEMRSSVMEGQPLSVPGGRSAAPASLRNSTLSSRATESMASIRAEIDKAVSRSLPVGWRADVRQRLVFGDLPESLRNRNKGVPPSLEIEGTFDPYERIIYVSMAALDPVERTFEEAGHALKASRLIPDADYNILRAKAKEIDARSKFKIDERYGEIYSARWKDDPARLESALEEEAIMQMVAARARGDDFGKSSNVILDKLIKFFKAIRDMLGLKGFRGFDDVFEDMTGGAMAARQNDGSLSASSAYALPRDAGKVASSQGAVAMPIRGDDFYWKYVDKDRTLLDRIKFLDVNEMPRELLFVEMNGKKVVGVAALEQSPSDPDVFFSKYTSVDPKFQGKGIGKKLAQQKLDYVRSQGKLLKLSSMTEAGAERLSRVYEGAPFVFREGQPKPSLKSSPGKSSGSSLSLGAPESADRAFAQKAEAAKEILFALPPKLSPSKATTAGAELPVPAGKIRVYHSGAPLSATGESKRWVSTNRQYAKDYRQGQPLHYLDLDASDPRVNNADYPDQGVAQGFQFNFELSEAEARGLRQIDGADSATTTGGASAPEKDAKTAQGEKAKPKLSPRKVGQRIRDMINQAAAEGKLPREDANDLIARFDTLEKFHKDGGKAKEQLAKEIDAEAEHKKRQAALTETARLRVEKVMTAFRDARGQPDPAKAMIAMIENLGQHELPEGTVAVANQKNAIMGMALSTLDAMLHEFRGITPTAGGIKTALTGQVHNKARLNNVVRELFKEATGDKKAAEFAQAVAKVMEDLRQRFNAAGGAIGKREDFGLPQFHDPVALVRSGKDAWIKYITPLLDLARMKHPLTGNQMIPADLEKSLSWIYDNITSDGWHEREPSMAFRGLGSIANQRGEHRFLIFKDADTWMKYAEMYGNGSDPLAVMVSHVRGMAADIAAMEVLGPNPRAMLTYMQQYVQQQAGRRAAQLPAAFPAVTEVTGREFKQGGAKWITRSPTEYARSMIERSENMYNFYRGAMGGVPGEAMADTSLTIRNANVFTKLGSALLSAMVDPFLQHAARKFAGLPVTRTFADIFRQIAPGSEREARRAGVIADGYLAMHNEQAREAGAWSATGISGYLADRVISLSLLNTITRAGNHAMAMGVQGHMADQTAKSFRELTGPVQRLLRRHGLGEADWDSIRLDAAGRPVDADFLTPAMIHDAVKARGGDTRVAERYLAMALTESQYATATGTLRGRAMGSFGTRGGTPIGEITRHFMQFKGFAVNLAILQIERIAREFVSQGFSKGAQYAAWAVISGTLGGALVIQLKQIKEGKDPRDMSDPKFWINSLYQSGGLSIWGDLLYASENRFGGGMAATLTGPTVASIQDLANLTYGSATKKVFLKPGEKTNFGREASRMIRNNTPGSSLWYARLAWNRVLMDNLQRMMDPEAEAAFRRQVQNAKKNYGQQMWWKPGSVSPSRAPNMRAAIPALAQ